MLMGPILSPIEWNGSSPFVAERRVDLRLSGRGMGRSRQEGVVRCCCPEAASNQ
jgi:hypothetical protein